MYKNEAEKMIKLSKEITNQTREILNNTRFQTLLKIGNMQKLSSGLVDVTITCEDASSLFFPGTYISK
jgi:hypothetical protein